jgi:hypothetical protein
VHYYLRRQFGNDTSGTMQPAQPLHAVALDLNYVDQTWINAAVKLIPRLRG